MPKASLPSAIGLVFHHAYLVYDAKNNFYMASNAVPLQLVKYVITSYSIHYTKLYDRLASSPKLSFIVISASSREEILRLDLASLRGRVADVVRRCQFV